VGLLDYYRQFEGLSEEEVNSELREEAAERRRKALTRVPALDLSQTTSAEMSHNRIVSAISYVARRGLNRYPHTRGTQLRDELAARYEIDPQRVILGNGSAELLMAAARALIEPGQLLVTLWPSYPLYPIIARRAHGRGVRVSGGIEEMLQAAHEPDVRVVVLASPNDPTGELVSTESLKHLLEQLPGDIAVLLDEALVEFADEQPTNASLALVEEYPRLLVFRTFSKAWGLAGLRIGYAIGGPGSEALLAELEPDLGVSELSQAGALEAMRTCAHFIINRTRVVQEERPWLTAALRERGFEVTDSQANFLWAAHSVLEGDELAARLGQAGVLIAAGAPLGEPRHVRITIRDHAASGRLLSALDKTI
jgi:histidinol-phosphate aminotransferase